MLSPKKTKFRKQFKGRIHGASKGGTALNFGAYGLKALEPERVSARQIWAARVAPGRIMFEIDGVPDDVARLALSLGAAKLPIRVKVVTRLDAGIIAHTEAEAA